jgi:hypothetical protein
MPENRARRRADNRMVADLRRACSRWNVEQAMQCFCCISDKFMSLFSLLKSGEDTVAVPFGKSG